MKNDLDLIKKLASAVGYRFVIEPDGVERCYSPDGTLVLIAVPANAPAIFASVNPPPEDVYQSADGFWYRHFMMPGGIQGAQRVCEDCWKNMPPYANAKLGFVSPESEGKRTEVTINGEHCSHKGVMPLQKAVCRECLLSAYARVHPGYPLPDLSSELREDLNNAIEWTATNIAPTVIHLDADDGQAVQGGKSH